MIDQILPLLVVVAVIAAGTVWYRRTTGVARAGTAAFPAEMLRRIGAPPREPSLLLFTSPGCASCATAKRVLDEASSRLGVPVIVADVTEHPDIATSQHVYRAPTIFVVDDRGRALSRITGVPRSGEIDSVLAAPGGTAA